MLRKNLCTQVTTKQCVTLPLSSILTRVWALKFKSTTIKDLELHSSKLEF
jgi:hypothetical protein